jgi:hypothetical protein
VGCRSETARQVVLSEGMQLRADTHAGPLRVTAGRGNVRRYEFTYGGKAITKVVTLIDRAEAWGKLTGIYSGGQASGVRVVAQEGQLHVAEVQHAFDWMDRAPAKGWIYTRDGLVVGFSRSPERNQVSVDVVQVYVNGLKPHEMPGGSEGRLSIIHVRGDGG